MFQVVRFAEEIAGTHLIFSILRKIKYQNSELESHKPTEHILMEIGP